MRQTICEGVLESTTGNTPSKEASAFISMSNHMCIIKVKFIGFIKKQLYCTTLFTVNSSLPLIVLISWSKKIQAGKILKATGAEAGLQRNLQPLPPYPGWHMLPRAWFSSTFPLLPLLDQDCICSWRLQLRTKAWPTAPLHFRGARI